MIQTNEVVRRLEELYPEKKFEVVARTTVGDQVSQTSNIRLSKKKWLENLVDFLIKNNVFSETGCGPKQDRGEEPVH